MIHTTASSDGLVRVEEFEGRSLWQDAAGRLFRNKAAVVSLVILAVIATLAVFAPLLSPHDYDEIYWDRMPQPPDFANAHWLGTDGVGRDMFVRILYGARVSLAVGLLATAVSLVRSEEHTSELQSLMRISYAVFCLQKKNKQIQ